jgi:glycosyltransferase involved in cell wall biosynthesis
LGGVDSRNPTGLLPDEITELRGSNCVQWIDEVADVRPYLEAADIVVLPSYREGLPRSLLEGAAMGRALIATDVPGCRDVVTDDNGYLVPVQNADALAQAMLKFVNDVPSVALRGAAARDFVSKHFDESRVIEQTLATYRDLLHLKAKR